MTEVVALSLAVNELLYRVLARRTEHGRARVIFSQEDLEREYSRLAGQEEELRRLRNEVVHSCSSVELELLARLNVPPPTVQDSLMRKWFQAVAHHDERAQSNAVERSSHAAVVSDPALVVAEAFLQRLLADAGEVIEKLDDAEAERLGQLAAEQVIAGGRWSQIVGDRIDTTTASELLGVSRQALSKRQTSGSLLGLPGHGTTWFPVWQFDLVSETIRPEVRDLIGAFRDIVAVDVDPYIIAAWAATEQDEDLGGVSPAQWLAEGRDTGQLRTAARRAAERLAQ